LEAENEVVVLRDNNEPMIDILEPLVKPTSVDTSSSQQSRRNSLSRAKTLAKFHCHIQNKPRILASA